MQDGARSHTTNPVKEFLKQMYGEERTISKRFKFPSWPPRSPDLIPVDFRLWGYLKFQVYRSRPFNLSELKDVIR
ncbi:hypothetical protein TNCV_2016771 [Trichonephila clavipes]|nr:hypothetical protein TNCV_2016771 [Trichonephila clavipes]